VKVKCSDTGSRKVLQSLTTCQGKEEKQTFEGRDTAARCGFEAGKKGEPQKGGGGEGRGKTESEKNTSFFL